MNFKLRREFPAVGAMALLLLLTQPAAAQQPRSDGQLVVYEVIVTAQKREQSIQEVPIAITAMDGNLLESNGANNITDLHGIAPNVILTEIGLVPNIGKIAIRGMAFLDPDPNADPKTGFALDGVPLTRNAGILNDAFDIERVEILRGPQGTLFGRNNLAGTINMVSARPTEEAGGKIKITVGENGLRTVRAVANTGSFADGLLRAKVAGVTRDYDGYYKNAFTGNKLGDTAADGGRLTLALDNGRFDATVIADYQQEDVIGPGISNHMLDPYGTGYDGDKYIVNQNLDGFSDLETWGLTLESNLETDLGIFTLVAGTRDLEYFTYGDFDGRPGRLPPPPIQFHLGRETEHDQQTVELRFADSHSDTLDYVLGVFYLQEEYETHIHTNNFTVPLEQARITARNSQKAKSLAFFGQTDVWVSERLSLILGGRITLDDKEFEQQQMTPPFAHLTPDGEWDEFTWKAGLNYRFHDDLMAYATVATGYKGGGFNARASVPWNIGPYGSETVTSYEAGMKGDFLDKRMRINAAAFFADYADIVGVVRRPNAQPRGSEAIQETLGDADIFGIEFETTFLVNEYLSLNFNAGYLDAKWRNFYVDLNNDGMKTDNTHLDLPNAPKWTLYGDVEYRLPVAGGALTLHGDARYMSRHVLLDQVDAPVFHRQARTIFNAFVAYAPDGGRYRISAYGKNLSDESIRVGALNVVWIQNFFHRPREFGVEAQLNF